MPGLDELSAKYAGRVQVLALVGWGSPRQAAAVMQSKKLDHLPVLIGGGDFVNALDVEQVPTTFFVQADGTIVGRLVGIGSVSLLSKQADKLLAQAASPGAAAH